MPVLTSPDIAVKFKEKWLSLHPEDRDSFGGLGNLDDSLTNLQWLQNFSILTAQPERHSTSGHRHSPNMHPTDTESPSSPPEGDTAASGVPQTLGNHITSSATANASSGDYHQQATRHVYHHHVIRPSEEIDYKTNHRVKPPYSYATLICMAMRASKKTKITLSAIYNWITENFCYYRHAEPSWQNSIRHNLSLNKCFMKVARTKDEPGKGGFWKIDPQYADMFVDGVFKRRRTHVATHTAPQRRQGKTAPQHGRRRKHTSQKWVTGTPLLTPQPEGSEASEGVLDWTSGFEDIVSCSSSSGNFEDLDINMALNALGCGAEISLQGHPLGAGGRWCSGGGTLGAEPACEYSEVSDSVGEHLCLQQGVAQTHPPSHPLQYKELTSFPQKQPHPWEESREELQPIALATDQSFGCYEGFFTETVPWEGAWGLTCDL
ncbi:hypothetical protein ANANG_G00288520 [Anguilla anguilla]|uniref:Fork-head domain-containing protein n=1 Tax=Anguilla anguilla TaxID=7936 RepID=A0A9D3LND2_ANGAN|nr:hypothetical protein ANANG_G00288520 [Anguilla anguilla]